MSAYNDNDNLPPIQLLVPACAATYDGGLRLGWQTLRRTVLHVEHV